MSGSVSQDNRLPDGVIADAFYGKGRNHPDELLGMVTHLIETTRARPGYVFGQTDTVQEPRYRNEPNGLISILLTCPHCLRDTSLEFTDTGRQEFSEMQCPSCLTMIRHVCGPSLAAMLEKAKTAKHAHSGSAIEPANPVHAKQSSHTMPQKATAF